MKGDIDCNVVVFDCSGIKMSNFSLSMTKNTFQNVFNYYAERQYRVFVLYSDFLTRTLYKIMKPFIPDRTVQKIVFLNSNINDIRARLLEEWDLDVIPIELGGQNAI